MFATLTAGALCILFCFSVIHSLYSIRSFKSETDVDCQVESNVDVEFSERSLAFQGYSLEQEPDAFAGQ